MRKSLGLLGLGVVLSLFALESILKGFAVQQEDAADAVESHCRKLGDHERRLRWLEIGGGKCAGVPPGGAAAAPGSGEGA